METSARRASPSVYLLPSYDEYLIAYKDRDSVIDELRTSGTAAGAEFAHQLVIDGRLRGSWRRASTTATAALSVRPFRKLDGDERRALAMEVARYGAFVDRQVTLSIE